MTTENEVVKVGNLAIHVSTVLTPAGAPAYYAVRGFDTKSNPYNHMGDGFRSSFATLPVVFMAGPQPGGPNGVTLEALLTVCKLRLEALQRTEFASIHNSRALVGIGSALDALDARTLEVAAQG